jgi:hypothetical protein
MIFFEANIFGAFWVHCVPNGSSRWVFVAQERAIGNTMNQKGHLGPMGNGYGNMVNGTALWGTRWDEAFFIHQGWNGRIFLKTDFQNPGLGAAW